MYLPYLRGRQYELLAIRELLENSLIGKKVVPIIEPIKLTSTLMKTLELFIETQQRIAVILNPQVGNFSNEINQLDAGHPLKSKYLTFLEKPVLIKSYIVTRKLKPNLKSVPKERLMLIYYDKNALENYPDDLRQEPPAYNIVPDDRTFRRQIRKNRIVLDDAFEKQTRNADYASNEDEFFSDEHLYYREDGFIGFSDYSIVGGEYSESGFAPFTVAIHIVYFDSEGNLRIRHFLSDSNEDTNDPAGKFYEAVTKVVNWNKRMALRTKAMNIFEKHYREETYPGLGTVKKLSIMHHIELINDYLNKVPR